MEGLSCLNREADEAGFSTDVDFEVNAQNCIRFVQNAPTPPQFPNSHLQHCYYSEKAVATMAQTLVSSNSQKSLNPPVPDSASQARTAQTPGTRKPNLPPNQTLYVSNLPSTKIQKEDLRRSLYILFSTYGPVLDVVALRTMKMRGQAHIVYRDVQTATQAMRALQGFEFFGKDMVGQSDIFFF